MQMKIAGNAYRSTIVCIDSYQENILCGRLYNGLISDMVPFEGLMQLLLAMESILEKANYPQPFTAERSFRPVTKRLTAVSAEQLEQRGDLATFSLKVIFRQNASWQGTVAWLEESSEESFRSVLELAMLLNSALAVDTVTEETTMGQALSEQAK